MYRPLALPNLPSGPVTAVALSQRAPESVRKALMDRGIRIVEVTPCRDLPTPEQCHPDMLLCHLGGRRLMVGDPNAPYLAELSELGFQWELAEKLPRGTYPDSISLNALLLENNIIGLLPHIDKKITNIYKPDIQQKIFCRQGYARCSVCVVNYNSVITEDKSIYKALKIHNQKIDVLLISAGFAHLSGYPYGFIGGCSGLLDKDLLAFSGVINRHPDFESIQKFLSRHKVRYFSITDGALEDIGGIMPLCEN